MGVTFGTFCELAASDGINAAAPTRAVPCRRSDGQRVDVVATDKTSRLHPRHVVPKPAQAYEPEVPVKVREWISPALASPDFVLGSEPPAQPHSRVVVERPIRFADDAYLEVVRPSAQRAVQLAHQLCGILPCHRADGHCMD